MVLWWGKREGGTDPNQVPAPHFPLTDPRPDAVIYPDRLRRGLTSRERLATIQNLFGPVLGGQVHSSDINHFEWIARLKAPDGTLLSLNHADKTPRYRWVDQAEGVRYGYLIDPNHLGD